ncbi:MAG TPA: hypothetical protein VIL37_19800 [Natronosporangium sp.]
MSSAALLAAPPPAQIDAAELTEAVAATRRAARRGLLDGPSSAFRIGWARRIRSMAAYADHRDRYRRRYDEACAAADAVLRSEPAPSIGEMLPVVSECVAADQAVRAFVNHPAGDILADRLTTVEQVARVAAAALAAAGTPAQSSGLAADLVSVPTAGSYLELELAALAPVLARIQAADDPERELAAVIAEDQFGEAALELFQGQRRLLAATVRQLLAALAGRSPAELLRQMADRRQRARERRETLLARLAAVLPPALTARLRGALADIDELSTMDNREDTARSLAFDGLPDLLLRRRLFETLAGRGAELPDGVFDMHQDDLVEMARRYV